MMRMIRGIGFDLGETLIFYGDTPLSWASFYPAALAAVAVRCGAAPTAAQLAQSEQILARFNTRMAPRAHEVTAEEIFSLVLQDWNLDGPEKMRMGIEAFFGFFQQRMCPYAEAVLELTALRERAMPMGILTDVPYGMPRSFVERDLAGAGLAGLFDAALTSVEVGQRKPDPAGYIALAARLAIAPEEMLYVGNEAKDMVGARRAGAFSAFIDRSGSEENHGQDFTISSLAGIRRILS